jgi:phosphate transport system substrate-binding protein
MNKKQVIAGLIGTMFMLAGACGKKGKKAQADNQPPRESRTMGSIRVSADESFRPVIDAQINVFETEYPKTKIHVTYKNEAACLKDLGNDSIRLVIVSRGLTRAEEDTLRAKSARIPSWGRLAWDAIAVVVNNKSPRDQFTVEEIREMLLGTSKLPYQPVFDGLRSTSIVRYAIDSILGGGKLSTKVTGVSGSEAVIDFVAQNPSAIGFIGAGWIGNPQDPNQKTFLKKVKVASLKCQKCPTSLYGLPFALDVIKGEYPLVRGLYFMLKERSPGVGGNFVEWMKQQRGQLIFKRAYLIPSHINVYHEDVEIN